MKWASAAAGVASSMAGVGVGHLLAVVINPSAAPIVAVGSVIVDATPTPLKEWAAATFGTADKLVLIAGVVVGVLALAALAGVAAGRSLGRGLLVTAVLALIPAVAAMTRPAAGQLDYAPSVVAGVVGGLVLAWLHGRLPSDPAAPADAPPGADPGRRRFLLTTAGVAVGGGLAGVLAERLSQPILAPTPVTLPTVSGGTPVPAGLEARVPGISPLRTPIPDFYRIDIALSVPRPAPGSWRLTVDGQVDTPLAISFADLLTMPMIEADVTLTCVSNPIGGELCGSTRWQGVPVAHILEMAGVRGAADMVLSSGADGFSASTPLPVLLDGRAAMIAVAMDGQPLTAVHGAPARLLTPGLYGFVGATKWLQRLTVTSFAEDQAYWTVRGWSDHGPVKTATRIDTPIGRAGAGNVQIGGVAWATHRGISRVQVQVDNAGWRDAELGTEVGADYWRQWTLEWSATPGQHRIAARAYDGKGELQTDQVVGVLPDGPTGYHVIDVTVN